MIQFAYIFLFFAISVEAGYRCDPRSGYGYSSSGRVYVGIKYTITECARSCIRLKQRYNQIDAVTFSRWRACYCERWMTSSNYKRDWWHCIFVYVPKMTKNSKYTCQFRSGNGDGKSAYYIGRTDSRNECQLSCLERKEIDPAINGATFSTDNTKRCLCERSMNSVQRTAYYESCLFTPKKEEICSFRNGHPESGKYMNVGEKSTTTECVKSCLRAKWIHLTIDTITYSKEKSTIQCYCGTNSKGFRISSKWRTCSPRFPTGSYQCGISTFNSDDESLDYAKEVEFNEEKRITGGQFSSAHAWPWQVGIFRNDKFICGGSIIGPRLIVTAAHCIAGSFNDYKYSVKLGDHSHEKIEAGEMTMSVVKAVKHPKYNSHILDSDIALLKLESDVRFSSSIAPVCLPGVGDFLKPGAKCFISGWGKVLHSEGSSTVLKHLGVSIISHKDCIQKNSQYTSITDNMFCAMNVQSQGDSSCKGDSGGPLVCKSKLGRWVLMGVVSFGSNMCDARHVYPVFTKVPKFVSWLRNTALVM